MTNKKHSYILNIDENGLLVAVNDIAHLLDDFYDETDLGNHSDPFAELVYIILSVRTAETIYQQAYQNLINFLNNDWNNLLDANEEDVVASISAGGLAEKKTTQIVDIARTLSNNDTESIDVAYFDAMTTKELIDHLCSYSGIGVKVAKCIAMYALDRDTFPIDIHCARVGGRIGWYEKRTRYTRRYADLIDEAIPSGLRYRLHINLIQHGRAMCTSGTPLCDDCPINKHCAYHLALTEDAD